MKKTIIAIMFSVIILPFNIQAEEIKKCDVTFRAVGNPGLVTIDGEGTSPCAGEIELSSEKLESKEISLDLTKLETGISLRDRHMKNKYLQVKKYPKAVLRDLKKTDKAGEFEGVLDLHGVQKKVIGKYTVSGNQMQASFEIKLSDYEIKIPSFMGITVAETVSVKVELSK